MKVRDLMHHGVDSVGPACTAAEAARKMHRQNIGALVVREGDLLTGIVTDRDLVVRVLAEGLDADRVRVSAIMTPNPIWAYAEADVEAVARMMEERRIRRIPVIDRHEALVGMLTIDDLAQRGASRRLAVDVLRFAAARHA